MDDENEETVIGKRIRQYAIKSHGPFVVHIRSIKTPLESRNIAKFIRTKYKSEIVIRQVNENKIRVEFSERIDATKKAVVVTNEQARVEANDLPNCVEWNKKYHVYIQEKDVEVIGCIKFGATQEAKEIVSHGCGKFKNPLLPEIKILEASRFMTKTEDDDKTKPPKLTPTNDVRVTFSGLILPDFVVVDQMLIPVRKFHKRQMFCESCQRYNHTKAHCNNKERTAEPNEHACIHCKVDSHHTGDKTCPRRKTLEKRDKDNARKAHNKTFAEILKELDPNGTMPGENVNEFHFPLQLGSKRQRSQHSSHASDQPSTSRESPIRKKSRENEEMTESPPGFRNPMQDEVDMEKQVKAFIIDFIEDMELPPFIQKIIETFVVPAACKLVRKLTNSLKVKFGVAL